MPFDSLAHGVGLLGNLQDRLGHFAHTAGVELEPVDHRRGQPVGLGGGQILGVLGHENVCLLAHGRGHRSQGLVPLLARGQGQLPTGHPAIPTQPYRVFVECVAHDGRLYRRTVETGTGPCEMPNGLQSSSKGTAG